MKPLQADFFLKCAALSGLCAVVLGAFGAHALKGRLSETLMHVYHTGVLYHFVHTLALVAVAIMLQTRPASAYLRASACCYIAGIVLFSGSLYALAISGIRALGMITPIGGVLFILGWFLFWLALMRKKD